MKNRLTFANVMAGIAVFIALGGSAYAATKITGKNVRNGTLTGKDIRNGSVGAGKLRASTLPKPGWFLLNEAGDIEEQSGGFTVVSKPGVNEQPATNPNIYIEAPSSVTGKGITGSVAIQNTVDRNGDGMPDASFDGDVSVGACGLDTINCVPAGTEANDVIVVRALADNTNVASPTARAYVYVTP